MIRKMLKFAKYLMGWQMCYPRFSAARLNLTSIPFVSIAEYAYTLKITEKSDVYSFGVVLLELIIGKRPNDSSFGEDKDVVKWVLEVATSSKKDEGTGHIVTCAGGILDLNQLVDQRMNPSASDYAEIKNVLDVALLCTSALPINRPSMRRVVELLKNIPSARSKTTH